MLLILQIFLLLPGSLPQATDVELSGMSFSLLLPVVERTSSSASSDQEQVLFVGPHNISSADTASIPGTEPRRSNPKVQYYFLYYVKGVTFFCPLSSCSFGIWDSGKNIPYLLHWSRRSFIFLLFNVMANLSVTDLCALGLHCDSKIFFIKLLLSNVHIYPIVSIETKYL